MTSNTTTLLTLVVLSGCAYNGDVQIQAYDPCVNADYVVDGLCVTEGARALEPTLISLSIHATQEALAQHGYVIDLPKLFADHNVGLEIHATDSYGLEGNIMGIADDNQIVIEEKETTQLPGIYDVLSHEILHVVAQFAMDTPFDVNFAHTQEYMFREYSRSVEPSYPQIFTVEAMAYDTIMESIPR
jgi:hypothetical protein